MRSNLQYLILPSMLGQSLNAAPCHCQLACHVITYIASPGDVVHAAWATAQCSAVQLLFVLLANYLGMSAPMLSFGTVFDRPLHVFMPGRHLQPGRAAQISA